MPARAAWKGFLQVSQLQIPVKAFTATSTQPEIALNQLHRDCGQRIRQTRQCPVHGELIMDDIVSGYEHAEGQYLPLDPNDLAALQAEDSKAIAVDCFVSSREIDAVYHSGRTYYVVPDGPPGQRPFGVLREGMRQTDRHAVSRIVVNHRELLVLLRPHGRLIAMTVLEYPQKVRSSTEYEGEVATIHPGAGEQQLIGQLIEALTDSAFDLTRYRDRYTDQLEALIQQRLADAAPPEAAREESDEAALVAALRASLSVAGVDDLPARIPSRTQRGVPAGEDDLPTRKSG